MFLTKLNNIFKKLLIRFVFDNNKYVPYTIGENDECRTKLDFTVSMSKVFDIISVSDKYSSLFNFADLCLLYCYEGDGMDNIELFFENKINN